MLSYLKVKNVALLEDINVEFHPGLNLLTGETGAGKSLLVDALQLLTGAKLHTDILREGEENASIEGIFIFQKSNELDKELESMGISYSDDQYLLKREFHKSKKQKCLINNSFVTLANLKHIGSIILDIFGQVEHQSLLQPDSQLEYLDTFSNNETLLSSLNELVHKIQELKTELKSLKLNDKLKAQKLDYLNFQINEIQAARLKAGEDQELLAERSALINFEQISSLCQSIIHLLSDDEHSLFTSTASLTKYLEELNKFTNIFSSYHEQLKPAKYILEDLSLQIHNYVNAMQYNPEKLNIIEQRLYLIERLKKKYGTAIEEILENLQIAEIEKAKLEESDWNIEKINQELSASITAYKDIAENLSGKRSRSALQLKRLISKELPHLALSKCTFEIELLKIDPIDNEDEVYISDKGYDQCTFMIEPNPGEGLHPLSKIASGGELSRLMLALKTSMASKGLNKTLIFDEIDKGIGGLTAEVIAKKLKALSKVHQVICVTHLPQIAAYADHHYFIDKKIEMKRTITFIEKLTDEEQVKEIARMLGSKIVSPTALKHAQALLDSAKGISKVEGL